MEVLDQRAPRLVLIQDDVCEREELAVALGEDRARAWVRCAEALGPDSQAVREDVAVEEGVGICAAVVAAPAVGV